jgi:hypothetical protein
MFYYFYINISSKEFLPYYQGKIHAFVVTTTEGLRVQFPAIHLKPYLLSSGIKGYFCMETRNNKFVGITKK